MALIESTVSSNRIEGVEVEKTRFTALVFGQPLLQNRDEEEVKGYRDALDLIHAQGSALTLSEEMIQHLHHLTRGQIWDAGQYKEKDSDIIEKYPDGRERVRFKDGLSPANAGLYERLNPQLARLLAEAPGAPTYRLSSL